MTRSRIDRGAGRRLFPAGDRDRRAVRRRARARPSPRGDGAQGRHRCSACRSRSSCLWQASTSLGWFTVVQLPSPWRVFDAAIELIERGTLGGSSLISTQRVLVGFAIGASLGLLLGAVTGLARTWDLFFGSTLGAIRAVPSLAWVPLLILWLKIGEESKITLIAIGAFFPVYTTVSGALRHVDRDLVEAGRAFGLRGVRLFTTIQLPAVLPSVISGLRLALAQSWLFLVAAELIASSAGLGFLLVDSQNNGRVDRILLAIILLAVLGKTTDSVLGVFERWAVTPMDLNALVACTMPRSTTVYPDALLRGIYGATRTIAMVGASPNWNRPSYFVMRYLQRKGFRVIPVNPRALDEPILGETVYPDLESIPVPVDVVDVFRRPEEVPEHRPVGGRRSGRRCCGSSSGSAAPRARRWPAWPV